MKVYYAHMMSIYDTPQEQRDIKTLEALGFEVVNPNQPEIQDAIQKWKESPNPKRNYEEKFHEIFGALVKACDVFAFRAFPITGQMPLGIFRELEYAQIAGKPIIELPTLTSTRMLGKEDTIQLLKELGQR